VDATGADRTPATFAFKVKKKSWAGSFCRALSWQQGTWGLEAVTGEVRASL